MATTHLYTVNGLANLFDIEWRVMKRKLQGLEPDKKGKQPKWTPANVMKHMSGQDLSPQQEKARLDKARADKVELEVDTMRGTLIPLDQVGLLFSTLATTVKSRLRGIPSELSVKVAACTCAADAEEIIENAISIALNELADQDIAGLIGQEFSDEPEAAA